MWYLILTLSMGIEGGTTITAIPFDNEKTCMIAAKLWLEDTSQWANGGITRTGNLRRAMCSPK